MNKQSYCSWNLLWEHINSKLLITLLSLVFGGLSSLVSACNSQITPQTEQDSGSAGQVIAETPQTGFFPKLAQVTNVPQGTFKYGGSTTFAPLRSDLINLAIIQAHPGFKLLYVNPIGRTPGSGTGIQMLLQGQISFSQSSRPLKLDEIQDAKSRGFALEQKAIAIDGIAIYVNPLLPIRGLTESQLRSIFTGQVKNWQQLNGPDIQITAFSRNPKDGGTPDFFSQQVLEKQNFGTNIKFVADTTSSIQAVAQTPGGIGYASAAEVVQQQSVKPIAIAKDANQPFIPPFSGTNLNEINKRAFSEGVYPITRRLFIIIKKDGGVDEQAGLAYYNLMMSDEGQELVDKAGFIPIRSSISQIQ